MVYLYIPAVKPGRTKKLASPWTGPYTITDRTGPYNVRIQLVGGRKNLIVHVNRLKPYYGVPEGGVEWEQGSSQLFDDIVQEEGSGGYVSLDEEDNHANEGDDPKAAEDGPEGARLSSRPQRSQHPPDHYGIYVSHSP
jgi:hypothetical protein